MMPVHGEASHVNVLLTIQCKYAASHFVDRTLAVMGASRRVAPRVPEVDASAPEIFTPLSSSCSSLYFTPPFRSRQPRETRTFQVMGSPYPFI